MVGRGLLQEHFSKTFVKISAVTIHVNPPGSCGSLPEMQPDSCTPGSETEPPGCENTKKKKKNFFFFLNNFPDHHFCAYVW